MLLPIWDATVDPIGATRGIGRWEVATFALVAPVTVWAIERAEWAIPRG